MQQGNNCHQQAASQHGLTPTADWLVHWLEQRRRPQVYPMAVYPAVVYVCVRARVPRYHT